MSSNWLQTYLFISHLTEPVPTLLVQQELKKISLMQIMDDIADEAERNGLTPEILESILADDE